MSSNFIGEIRAFPYDFAPYGWLDCDGTEVPISTNQTLYAVIGITYGSSNPSKSFKLPDLRGTAAIMFGQGPNLTYRTLATKVGTEVETLTGLTVPPHTHTFNGVTGAGTLREAAPKTDNSSSLTNIGYKASGATNISAALAYLDQPNTPVLLNPGTIQPASGINGPAAPHENRSPYLAIRYCICTIDGDYPPIP